MFDRATEKRTYDANGNPIGDNPDYDPDVFPVERFVSFGEGVRKRRARRLLRREKSRLSTPAWRGTITLTADPQETHRLDIKAGDNIRLRGFGGSGESKVFHVSGVSVNAQSEPISVTCTVDTLGRPLPVLRAEIMRDRRRKTDPAWVYSQSRNDNTADALLTWDEESGAGEIAPVSLPADTWTVIEVVAGQAGSVAKTKLETDPPVEFSAALFGDRVTDGGMNANIGDPFATDFNWDGDDLGTSNTAGAAWLDDNECIVAWGAHQDPAGYGRLIKSDPGATLSGKLVDDSRFGFFNEFRSPFLFLAVYPKDATTLSGRFKIQLAEAE